MMMKMENGWVYIKAADKISQEPIMKSWGMLKWNRAKEWFEGMVSRELLNRLRSITRLPAPIEEERIRLNQIQEAVDKERTLPPEELKPLTDYPVTKSLYAHQVRAANMALLTFGLADPKEVLGNDAE